MFYLNRNKCLLFTNKETLYSSVRLNIRKKDLADLPRFFTGSLVQQLQADGLPEGGRLGAWINPAPALTFCRTDNDKKVIGSMNDLIFQVKVAGAYWMHKEAGSPDTIVGSHLNNSILGYIRDRPLRRLRKVLDDDDFIA